MSIAMMVILRIILNTTMYIIMEIMMVIIMNIIMMTRSYKMARLYESLALQKWSPYPSMN